MSEPPEPQEPTTQTKDHIKIFSDTDLPKLSAEIEEFINGENTDVAEIASIEFSTALQAQGNKIQYSVLIYYSSKNGSKTT